MTCSSGRTRGWEVDKEDDLGFLAQNWCGAVGIGHAELAVGSQDGIATFHQTRVDGAGTNVAGFGDRQEGMLMKGWKPIPQMLEA